MEVKDALDVAEVLFAFSFFVEDQLPEDDVFGGGNVEGALGCLFGEAVLPGPGERGVAIAWVEIGFEAGWNVDDVEVTAAVAGDFRGDDVGGGAVVVGFGEKSGKCGDVFWGKKDGDVDVEGEAGFAIVHGADGTGDEVAEAGLVEGAGEEGEEVRFWRGRIHGRRVFGSLLRRVWGGLGGWQRVGRRGP